MRGLGVGLANQREARGSIKERRGYRLSQRKRGMEVGLAIEQGVWWWA